MSIIVQACKIWITLATKLTKVTITVYRATFCMGELYCPMRREFVELRYLGLLSVVLPYQADLETVTKVVIDYSEGGGGGYRVWGNNPFVPRLDTSNLSIFQYICMYVYTPVYILLEQSSFLFVGEE